MGKRSKNDLFIKQKKLMSLLLVMNTTTSKLNVDDRCIELMDPMIADVCQWWPITCNNLFYKVRKTYETVWLCECCWLLPCLMDALKWIGLLFKQLMLFAHLNWLINAFEHPWRYYHLHLMIEVGIGKCTRFPTAN